MHVMLLSLCLAGDPAIPSGDHTQCRGGFANCTAWWAVAGRSKQECGGLIGGGSLARGGAAGPHDGTWGWDYVGRGWRPDRFFLSWYPDGARQPKPGTYKVDGPRVPDVFAVKPIKRAVEKHRHVDKSDE